MAFGHNKSSNSSEVASGWRGAKREVNKAARVDDTQKERARREAEQRKNSGKGSNGREQH